MPAFLVISYSYFEIPVAHIRIYEVITEAKQQQAAFSCCCELKHHSDVIVVSGVALGEALECIFLLG
jgi:hypothetical protein